MKLNNTLFELVKTRKLKDAQKTMVGFGNLFWRILKNNRKGLYVYGFRDFTTRSFRVLYSGETKLKIITPLFLTIACLVFNIVWIPFIIITYFPFKYFDGGRNFIRDTAWYNNVRFFNWVNIVVILLLIVFLIFIQSSK